MTAQSIKTPRKPTRKPPVKRKLKVNIENALILKQAGQSYKEIAAEMNTCPSNVHKQLQHLLPTELTDTYKKQRADIFANLQLEMVQSVDSDAIKAASLLQRITAVGILYDKERLERNLSTANVAYDPGPRRAELAELRAMLSDASNKDETS